MNIHEYQAKKILKDNGAPVSNGFVISSTSEIENKLIQLKGKKFVLKAQIHAGGRGKAGGIRLVEGIDRIKDEAEKMFGKVLVTHQTGPKGKEVKKLYIEEASNIAKEFYLSCLVDRASSKIAFISSTKGGVDIEKVAKENPEEIITTKINPTEEIKNEQIEQIIKPFNFNEEQKREGKKLIHSLFKILTTESKIICLDAKMNFDDNAMFRQPEIFELRDLNEEDPKEIEAKNYDLAYIKLNGSIGCMVNGAGLAMATMDIIKFYGEEPANFLDVGGGASKEKVSAAFKLILSDKNVKAILINIFGGIMRCDVLAQGVVDAAKESELSIPLVVRLAGTNFTEGKAILDKSGLKILSASDLNDAAKKVVEAIK